MRKFLIITALYFISLNMAAQTCTCNPLGWQPFTATVGKTPAQKASCGHQFAVPKAEAFKLAGAYACLEKCAPTYTAVLKNNITGTVIKNYPVFLFPWKFTFADAGNYKLEIIPACGDKKCNACIFYITVM